MIRDFTTTRKRMARTIRNWGRPAVLRSVGNPDVWCRIAIMEYSAQERMGRQIDPVDRKVLMAAATQDGDAVEMPDYTKERLVTFKMDGEDIAQPQTEDENLLIVGPPGRVGTGDIAIFYRLQVRR